MFARLAGCTLPSDMLEAPSTSQDSPCWPANCWIWSEQSISAQRRAFGCPPLDVKSLQTSRPRQSVLCRGSRSRAAGSQVLRRPPKSASIPMVQP
eukprot:jgi/Chrzof1/1665/Cz10g16130.t1